MAKRSVKRTVKVIDPMFHIPDGVDELTYNEPEDSFYEGYEDTDLAGAVDSDSIGDEGEDDNSGVPSTPDIIGIEQTVRRLPDGTAVVDVVVLIEGPDGYTYEAHATKT